jgi:hypothetical protein
MVIYATFNNVSDISFKLLNRKKYHSMFMVIGTDCIVSCKSNNHTITAKTVPIKLVFVASPHRIKEKDQRLVGSESG